MKKFWTRWALRGAAAFAAWGFLAGIAGPFLIRKAYAGEAWGFLNAVIAGRDVNPVGVYLDAWWSLVRSATLGLVLLFGLTVLLLRFSESAKSVVRSALSGSPSLEVSGFMSLAVTLGFLGGLAEATYLAIRQLVITAPATDFYPELLLTAPLSGTVAALFVASGIAVAAAIADSRLGVWKGAFLFGLPGVYGVIQADGIPLHPVAEIVVALGLGTVLARLVVRYHDELRPAWSRTAMAATAMLILGTAGALAWHSPWREGRRISQLPSPATASLPNILLIILDTVRAANVGAYGYARPTTPTLADWADSGTLFERASSVAPWTLPSHASMFTGLYNVELQVGPHQPLSPEWTTLAERLAAHGYATGGFVANPVYTTRLSGLQQGFIRYKELPITASRVLVASEFSRSTLDRLRALAGVEGWRARTAADVTTDFIEWLEAPREDRPFFAFLNFFDAHSPYSPPVTDGELFGERPSESWYTFYDRWLSDPDSVYTPESVEPWVDMYDSAIRYMDAELVRLRASLETEGLTDNTLVIITSDHGEMWGERGLLDHVNTVYDPVLHVPLIVVFPGRVPAGVKTSRRVTLRDLSATVLDLTGLPSAGEDYGVSWSWSWTDGSGAGGSPLVSQDDTDDETVDRYARGRLRSVYDGPFHYVFEVETRREELYDLSRDALESNDLSSDPTHAQALRDLREQLRAFLQERGAAAEAAALPPS